MKIISTPNYEKRIISQQIYNPDDPNNPINLGETEDSKINDQNIEPSADLKELTPEDFTEKEEDSLQDQDKNETEELQEKAGYPKFTSIFQAARWAKQNLEVMRINYTTLSGISLIRDVEPHGDFVPKTTKRRNMATWDETVGDIRSYILGNITKYQFTGEKFTPKFSFSQRRKNYMTRLRRRKNNREKEKKMANMIESIEHVAATLPAELSDSVNQLYSISKGLYSLNVKKEAMVQGYWIRNTRCWSNCYRQKRATSPKKAAQEVWQDCYEEYSKSLSDDKSGWEKYAGTENKSLIKIASKQEAMFDSNFNKLVKDGVHVGNALVTTAQSELNRFSDDYLNFANRLATVASILKSRNQPELAEKLISVSEKLLGESDKLEKQAQFGGFGNRMLSRFKGIFQGEKGKINSWLTDLNNKASAVFQAGTILKQRTSRENRENFAKISRDLQAAIRSQYNNLKTLLAKEPKAQNLLPLLVQYAKFGDGSEKGKWNTAHAITQAINAYLSSGLEQEQGQNNLTPDAAKSNAVPSASSTAVGSPSNVAPGSEVNSEQFQKGFKNYIANNADFILNKITPEFFANFIKNKQSINSDRDSIIQQQAQSNAFIKKAQTEDTNAYLDYLKTLDPNKLAELLFEARFNGDAVKAQNYLTVKAKELAKDTKTYNKEQAQKAQQPVPPQSAPQAVPPAQSAQPLPFDEAQSLVNELNSVVNAKETSTGDPNKAGHAKYQTTGVPVDQLKSIIDKHIKASSNNKTKTNKGINTLFELK